MADSKPLQFDVWGCRGSRSLDPSASRVGYRTSCYSLGLREEIVVFDAGRGLTRLSRAILEEERYQGIKRIQLLISHSHMDHWEGLKDADWFWQRGTGLEIKLYGTEEALDAIRRAYEPPSFVDLEILALGTIASIGTERVKSGADWETASYSVQTVPLNHFSGPDNARRHIDAIGFKVAVKNGPTIAYLCDHQPEPETAEMEDQMLTGADLALIDAHFTDRKDQAYGHGSQEHAAFLAKRHPETIVLATHHGAGAKDAVIEGGFARHGDGVPNLHLAREGRSFIWQADARRFRSL